jgi:conjugative relaxase-like TrwC/TraI family protein
MLSIGSLSGGDQGYYLKLTNVNYYTEGGEPEGRWYGPGAREFGLQGKVEKEHLERLCNGFDHLTGEKKLVQNAGVFEGKKARSPGHDMTFSADKTVSALFAVADGDLRNAIRKAHDQAVKAALDLAQEKAGFARIGRDGQAHVRAPLLWATFEHSMSRAQDPNLHTHCLLINLTMLENGKTRTVDPTYIYHWQKALGAVYRAQLARELQELGFEVEQFVQGSSVVAVHQCCVLEVNSVK